MSRRALALMCAGALAVVAVVAVAGEARRYAIAIDDLEAAVGLDDPLGDWGAWR